MVIFNLLKLINPTRLTINIIQQDEKLKHAQTDSARNIFF